VGSIDFMLRKIDEGLAAVTQHYADVKDADSLPDDLLYAIRNLVQDCQSALDWTMSDVHKRYVANKGRPYFPLVADHDELVKALDRWLPQVRAAHPDIAAAFERHQPYRAGNAALGHLHELSGVNKHRQFSTQRLDVVRPRAGRRPVAATRAARDVARSCRGNGTSRKGERARDGGSLLRERRVADPRNGGPSGAHRRWVGRLLTAPSNRQTL
jgi:hypothetical protein